MDSSSSSSPPAPAQSAPDLSSSAVAPSAAFSDSAPPPQSLTTAPPPRDYHAHSPPLHSLPPAYAPNSTVPQFIRALAFFVFVLGGTTAAAITWTYKSFIYPRLVLALQARTKLTEGHLGRYQVFLGALREVRKAPGFLMIRPKEMDEREVSAEAEEGMDAVNEKEEVRHPEKEAISEKGEMADAPTEEEEEEPSPALPTPAPVLLPLQTSLSSLVSTFPPTGTYTRLPSTLSPAPSSMSEASSASEGLLGALATLTSYIDTESYAVVTSSYRSYGTTQNVSGGSKERKSEVEAVGSLKAEIRSVKGALLNRRNFAALAPRGGEVAAA